MPKAKMKKPPTPKTAKSARLPQRTRPAKAVLRTALRQPQTPPAKAPASDRGVGGAAAIASAPTGTTLLPLAQLRPSGLNPRRSFEPAALKELEDSIVAQGLIEPIVVRPSPARAASRPARRTRESADAGRTAPTPGVYDVIAGERRYRAIKAAVAARRLPADWPIGVVVRPLDDKAAVELALAENVQRESMHPLEEGEALSKLARAGEKTESLARLMGKTQRWVQKRIRLAEQLAPKARAKFLKGGIALAAALELSRAPAALQERIAAHLHSAAGEEHVRDELDRKAMPVADAIFPRAAYDGAIIAGEDGQPTHYVDGPKAAALQRAAAKEKAAALAKQWAWAEYVETDYLSTYDYGRSQDRKKAGCIVRLDPRDLEVAVITGLVKPTAKKGKNGASAKKQPRPPFTDAHLCWAHGVKTIALQRAMIDAPDAAELAMLAALLALLAGSDAAIQLRAVDERRAVAGWPASPAAAALRDQLRPAVAAKLLRRDWAGRWVPPDPAAFIAWARDPAERLPRLFAAAVAARCGAWVQGKAAPGDWPNAIALARAASARVRPADVALDAAYLNRLDRAGLERVARACIPVTNGQGAHKFPAKKADLVAWILGHPQRDPAWVPPECAFATDAEILAAAGADKVLVEQARHRAAGDADDFDDEPPTCHRCECALDDDTVSDDDELLCRSCSAELDAEKAARDMAAKAEPKTAGAPAAAPAQAAE